MLAIASIVAIVSIESIRVATSNGVRIEQAARFATGSIIDQASLRTTIAATLPDYLDSEARFAGTPSGFSAVTSAPLTGPLGPRRAYSLALETSQDGSQLQLLYREGDNIIQVAAWPGATGAFDYFVEPAGDIASQFLRSRNRSQVSSRDQHWTETWPDPDALRGLHYIPLPVIIRLSISEADGSDTTMLFYLPVTAPPPFRDQDLFGSERP
ncbi:hypothetical protein [Maricaulis sp. CAU 1757]